MSQFKLRPAEPHDVAQVVKMIRELAEFEQLLDQCQTTEELVMASAFPSNGNPLIKIVIAELESNICGFALYFYNYSTFTGRPGIYLEDLYVREQYRGQGLGTKFFKYLKNACVKENCPRLEWAVLDWNQSARTFYTNRVGAKEMNEWILNRCDGESLINH